MRPGSCDNAIMFEPKAQKEGRGIFGPYNNIPNITFLIISIQLPIKISYWFQLGQLSKCLIVE